MVLLTTGRLTTTRLHPITISIAKLWSFGLSGNPSYPPYDVPLPPIPLGKLGKTLAKGFNQLGWHWWPSDTSILSRDYQGETDVSMQGPVI